MASVLRRAGDTTERFGHRVRTTGAVLIALAGLALTWRGFYPGLMSPDSSGQFMQARRFVFSDGHPVVMALVWAGTHRIVRGPVGIFLLLQAMYWGGFLLLSLTFARRSRLGYAIALALPFLPFVINFSGTLWKDVLVFDCFLVAFAIVLLYASRGRRIPIPVRVAVLAVVLVGSLARYNSVLAAIPLVYFLLAPNPAVAESRGAWRSLAAATAIVLALSIGAGAALNAWLKPEKTYLTARLYLFDLIGMSHGGEVNFVPSHWSDTESRDIFTTCYEPKSFDFTWLRCDWLLQRLQADGLWPQLARPWLQAIVTHPGPYLAHRMAYIGTLFLKGHLPFNAVQEREAIEYGFRETEVFRFFKRRIPEVADELPLTMFFTQGFWLVAAPVLFLLHIRYRGKHPAATYPGLIASASAALYTAPLAVVGLAHDFRYVYWGIGACCISMAFAVDAWRNSTQVGRDEPQRAYLREPVQSTR